VHAKAALWVPRGITHNIWQLTLHLAYWTYAVRKHLEPDAPAFPRTPHDWPLPPATPDQAGWACDRELLRFEHAMLLKSVRAFPVHRLNEVPATGKRWTFAEMILGVAAHDAYHVAQIKLIKSLRRTSQKSASGNPNAGK
jgi:hypothetical protein